MAADPSDFASVYHRIQQQLACPACQGVLHLEHDRVVCVDCGRDYPIVEGIPVLIPGETPHA